VLYTLIDILNYLIELLRGIVIVQFVLSLLISFNVVNLHNDLVQAIWRAVNVLLEPFLRPLRRIMPDTRPIDFSPMALIVLLSIVQIVLGHLAFSAL